MIHTISRDGKTIILTKEEVRDIIEGYSYATRPLDILDYAMELSQNVCGNLGVHLKCADRHLYALPMYDELRIKGEAYVNDPILYECILADWAAPFMFKQLHTDLETRNSILRCIDTTIRDRIAQIKSALNSDIDEYAYLLHSCAIEAENARKAMEKRKKGATDTVQRLK